MSDLAFAVQVFLERHFAPVLILCRRLLVGYPYRRIPLTQGKFACVDPQDYPALARYKWCAAKQGNSWCAVRTDGERQVRMHRMIMRPRRGRIVDHIDGHGLNNRRCNLRVCTRRQNLANQKPRGGSSRFVGVHRQGDKWVAGISCRGTHYHLGLFDDEVEAAKARDRKAYELHGVHAYLNFPEDYRRHPSYRSRKKRKKAKKM